MLCYRSGLREEKLAAGGDQRDLVAPQELLLPSGCHSETISRA